MLKRLLLIWLILCTTGYGSVWAFDGHLDAAAEHGTTDTGLQHAQDGGDGHPDCDHCCHAWAHIIALFPALTAHLYQNAGTGSTPYRQRLVFQSTAPPDRPPQG